MDVSENTKLIFDKIKEIQENTIQKKRANITKIEDSHKEFIEKYPYYEDLKWVRTIDDLLKEINELNEDYDWIMDEIEKLFGEAK